MKVCNDFQYISKFRGQDPGSLLIGTFIASPLDQVLKLAFASLVYLGVKNFRDLKLQFSIDDNRWRQNIDLI